MHSAGEAARAPRRWSATTTTRSEVKLLCYDAACPGGGGAAVRAKRGQTERGRAPATKGQTSQINHRLPVGQKGRAVRAGARPQRVTASGSAGAGTGRRPLRAFSAAFGSQRRRLVKSQVMRGDKKFTASSGFLLGLLVPLSVRTHVRPSLSPCGFS